MPLPRFFIYFKRGIKDMTIKLYINNSTNNTVDKDLTEVSTIEGTIRTNLDSLSPVIQIEQSGTIEANYLYIQELNKYYYINHIVYNYNGITTIEAREDVLKTFSTEIKAQTAIVSRSTELYNLYLQDTRQTQQNSNTYIYEFPNSLDSYVYLLTTSGSSQNITTEE